MSQANICLPGQECQDEGCFSPDPGFTDRMWAAMYGKYQNNYYPQLYRAVRYFTKNYRSFENFLHKDDEDGRRSARTWIEDLGIRKKYDWQVYCWKLCVS